MLFEVDSMLKGETILEGINFVNEDEIFRKSRNSRINSFAVLKQTTPVKLNANKYK